MQSLLTTTAFAPLTMSSREIAQLTGKEHRNVGRDVRKMLVELHGERGVLSFERTYQSQQNGQDYVEYLLPKRETLILVSGYSIELRARIIDRLEELEGRHVPVAPNLSDPLTLRQLLLANVDKVIELENRVEAMRPALEAMQTLVEAHGSFSRTEAAKNLGVPPHLLIKWMRTNGWTYRRPGSRDDLAYQSKIFNGYLEHKIATGPRPDGTEWASTQIRVTPKGLTALAKAFPASARAA